jgi:hypothetical protein
MKVSTTTTILGLSSPILCIGAPSTDSFSTLKSLNEIASYYSQTDDTALLQSTSNATHAFDYILVMSDGSTEINDFVVIALDNIESEMATAPPLERRDPRCFNNVNKAKGAGCPVNKGLGYFSGHNCKNKGGKYYSCQIKCPDGEGGDDCYTEECLKVNQAGGLEGGYCYK